MLNTKRRLSQDLERIKSISAKLDRKIAEAKPSKEDKIDKLSLEELEDLDKIVSLANFMLTKYQDKKEMRSILKEFVDIVSDSAKSLEAIDDEVSELILEAEDSIGKVKDMHSHISEKSDFKGRYHDGPDYNKYETSSINLTKTVTGINTIEYQQNSKEDA